LGRDGLWLVCEPGYYQGTGEGSIVMALGAATIHEITFKDGMVEQRNFYDYKMPRFRTYRRWTYILWTMMRQQEASGTGPAAVFPALTNAIFDLTGNRIRKLPLI
jgi:isoquinoline 1-oxidoreductase beta subunit